MAAKKLILYTVLIAATPAAVISLARTSAEFAGRILEKRYPPPGRMIALGDYRLHLYCAGAGSPAVIIEPGMGVDWVSWRFVIARLTSLHMVCVYDRAGYGWSDPAPKPRTALREADELHLLLETARIPKPYILTAHSFGGYIARIYASRFAESVAGVVLAEPALENETASIRGPAVAEEKRRSCLSCGILNLIPPLGIQRLKRMYDGNGDLPNELKNEPRCYQERYLVASSLAQLELEQNESDSLHLSQAEVRQAVFPRYLPFTVITALHTLSPSDAEVPPSHLELQRRLAESSVCGTQIIARQSGHLIPLDQPSAIADAVLDLANKTTTGQICCAKQASTLPAPSSFLGRMY